MARARRTDDEGPTQADVERFGDVTRTCPSCRAALYDDAEICWKCGEAIVDQPRTPRWIVVTSVVLVVVILLGLVMRWI